MKTLTIEEITEKVAAMVGYTYMCNFDGQRHHIIDAKVDHEGLVIGTDRRKFSVELHEANALLNDFYQRTMMGSPSEMTISQAKQTSSAVQRASMPEVSTLRAAGEIKDILMENIRKVQEDREYIAQATAINDSVKVIIELAKTEIRGLELMDKARNTI